VEIGGHKFVLGQCKERDQQLQELKQIVESETSHYQWSKQGLNISLLGMQILMNLFLGSSSSPSIIGIKNCTGGYWLVYASFLAVCAVATLIAIRIARKEQGLKQQFGNINIVKSDLILTRKNLTALCSLGFFGGVLAGAFGLGGGIIYNPSLLYLGLPPMVCSASGLYLV
jgi:uncharacterized membrane protein YfcA